MMSMQELFRRDKHVCPWWLAYTFDNPLRNYVHDPRKILGPYLGPGMTAVDIGCGMGFFSRGMAQLVGDSGAVIAVDLQQEMLDITRRRAERDGVSHRIRLVRVEQGNIGVTDHADLVLGFWMVHEVSDLQAFFAQVFSILKQTGTFLIAEPRIHVSSSRFEEILSVARTAGFTINDFPRIRFSRAVVLRK
jgi:ubiquinone/menaquinone biosynthesis C-methylase UbiE